MEGNDIVIQNQEEELSLQGASAAHVCDQQGDIDLVWYSSRITFKENIHLQAIP